jgi:hypothetical protein
MIMQETWVMIKHPTSQGVSIQAIARQLGIDPAFCKPSGIFMHKMLHRGAPGFAAGVGADHAH